jgi:hypothetical protein
MYIKRVLLDAYVVRYMLQNWIQELQEASEKERGRDAPCVLGTDKGKERGRRKIFATDLEIERNG